MEQPLTSPRYPVILAALEACGNVDVQVGDILLTLRRQGIIEPYLIVANYLKTLQRRGIVTSHKVGRFRVWSRVEISEVSA